jgi:NAD(P)-dependent dehydrogenase (short-subunit alcohol dehydrogenase family)
MIKAIISVLLSLTALHLLSPFVLWAHIYYGDAVARVVAAALTGCVVLSYLATACSPSRRAVRVPDDRAWAAVVTGCDSGFGEMTARALAARGMLVFAGCLTEEGARGLRGVDGIEASLLDVTRAESIDAFCEKVRKWRKHASQRRVFCLVNNAGVGASGPVDLCPLATYRSTMEVNFFGAVAMTKALLDLLYADAAKMADENCAPPRVVNVTSVAGLLSASGLSAYSASKFALEAFSDSLRRESSPWPLAVSIIEPSFLKTRILAGAPERVFDYFNAASPAARARWGAAWAYAAAKGAAAIQATAEPAELGTEAIVFAALANFPPARVRAGTQGVWLLPYLGALPAGLSDWILHMARPGVAPHEARTRGKVKGDDRKID